MAVFEQTTIYDELLDLLAETADDERMLSFRLSPDKQARLDALLEKNREESLSPDESAELESFEHFEHMVRLLKARVLKKQKPCARAAMRNEFIEAGVYPVKSTAGE